MLQERTSYPVLCARMKPPSVTASLIAWQRARHGLKCCFAKRQFDWFVLLCFCNKFKELLKWMKICVRMYYCFSLCKFFVTFWNCYFYAVLYFCYIKKVMWLVQLSFKLFLFQAGLAWNFQLMAVQGYFVFPCGLVFFHHLAVCQYFF